MRFAINGAGIAGPALAYWLEKFGHDVVLVEQSSQIRTGGYAIDFWGVGYDIAEKMGLLPRIREAGYRVTEFRYVNAQGRNNGGFSVDVFRRLTNDRFTEIARSDLAATIYHALGSRVETLFGDSIAEIRSEGGSVHVGFEHATPRTFDVVIGADGLHSRVRRLVFGSDSEFEVPLGFHVAAFQVKGYYPRDELIVITHGVPGRQITKLTLRDDTTLFLFFFRDKYLSGPKPTNERERKTAVRNAFAGVGWECPQILAVMDSSDVYFDRVSQIRMPHWTKERTALVGDAAACVSLLAGEGSGLAMAEAYVLAGELHSCAGDHQAAFARYEQRLMPFLKLKQHAAAKFVSAFAPKTALGVLFRNQVSRLLQIPFVANWAFGRAVRDDFKVPVYTFQ